jgi:hypothetical protein
MNTKTLGFLYYAMWGKVPEHEDIVWLYYYLKKGKV